MLHRISATLLAIVFLVTPALLAQRPAPETLVADTTAVFVKVDSPASMRPFIDGTHDLYKLEIVKLLLKQGRVDFAKMMGTFKKEMGVEASEILDLLDGPSAVAISPGAEGMDNPNFLVMVGVKPGEKTDAIFKTLMSKMKEKAGERLVTDETIAIGGIPVHRVVLKKGEDKTETILTALHGGLVLFGNDTAGIETLAAGQQGKEVANLTKGGDFAACAARLSNAKDVMAYFNMGVLWPEVKKDMRSAKDKKMFAAFGVEAIKCFAVGAGASTTSLDFTAYAHAPSARTGLMNMLTPPTVSIAGEKLLVAGAESASTFQFDFANAIKNIAAIAEAIMGSSEEITTGLEQMKEQLGVDLEKDLLGLMQSPITYVQLPGAEGSGMTRSAVSIRSSDAKKLLNTIKEIGTPFLGMVGGEMVEITVAGQPATHVKMDLGGDGVTEMPDPVFCATETHLVISLGGTPTLEKALSQTKDAPSLTATEDWKRATRGFSDKSWMLSYMRVESMIRNLEPVIEQLKMFMDLPDEVANLDPKAVAKTIDLLGMAVASDAAGIQISFRATMPPKQEKK